MDPHRIADRARPAIGRARSLLGRARRRARGSVPRPAHRAGRLPSLGQDHTAGHRSYVASLPPEGVRWLHTKPFSAPPTYEMARCMHSFAHIVERLDLGPGAQVLDVGCGPGWISEFLARCGYHVTGIDVSEEMVAIARRRSAAIPVGETGMATAPVTEFHAMPVSDLPWTGRFDAAILYDALHHFHDERATLEAIRRSLAPGGRIYVHEGVRPAPGSDGERELIEEMRRYGTLESPFDPEYLLEVVRDAGFEDVQQLIERDELVDLARPSEAVEALRRAMGSPTTNTLVAVNPIPADAGAEGLSGRIELVDGPRRGTGGAVELTVRVVNTGTAFWPVAGRYPYPLGSVNLAPWVPGPDGGRAELPRVPLPRFVPAGGSAEVEMRIDAPAAGDGALAIDLVREGVGWFGDLGGEALRVPSAPGPADDPGAGV